MCRLPSIRDVTRKNKNASNITSPRQPNPWAGKFFVEMFNINDVIRIKPHKYRWGDRWAPLCWWQVTYWSVYCLWSQTKKGLSESPSSRWSQGHTCIRFNGWSIESLISLAFLCCDSFMCFISDRADGLTVGGAQSPAATPPAWFCSAWEWTADGASRTERPCRGQRSPCEPLPVGLSALRGAPDGTSRAAPERFHLKNKLNNHPKGSQHAAPRQNR